MALSQNRRGSLSRGPAVGSRWRGVSLKLLGQHPCLGWFLVAGAWSVGPGGGGEAGERGRGTGGGALGPSGILGEPHTYTGGVSRDPFPQIKLWGFLCGSYVKVLFSFLSLSTSPMCKTLLLPCCAVTLLLPLVRKQMFCIWLSSSWGYLDILLSLKLRSMYLPARPLLSQVQLPSLLSAVLAPDPSSERASSLCGLCLAMGGWGEGIWRDDNYWATSCHPPSFPPAILAPWDPALPIWYLF